MGVIKRGILGGFSGKIGNIVGSSWKGIAVIKSLPLSVANPDTVAQQAQRNAMSKSVAYAKILLVSIIKPLWDRFAQGMSGYNQWVKENIANIDVDGLIDGTGAIFSIGKMTITTMTTATWSLANQRVNLDFPVGHTGSYQAASDLLYVVIYNDSTKEMQCFATGVTRAAGTAVINLWPECTTGDSVYVYTMFKSANGYYVDNSQVKEVTEVA